MLEAERENVGIYAPLDGVRYGGGLSFAFGRLSSNTSTSIVQFIYITISTKRKHPLLCQRKKECHYAKKK